MSKKSKAARMAESTPSPEQPASTPIPASPCTAEMVLPKGTSVVSYEAAMLAFDQRMNAFMVKVEEATSKGTSKGFIEALKSPEGAAAVEEAMERAGDKVVKKL